MMIVNIPIEPIEMRYSADWHRWFEEELNTRKYKYKTIMPNPITSGIKEGAFLDIIGTTHFKSTQVAAIAWNVNQGIIPRNERVVFLIHDGWFPVEQLAYMRDMLGCHEWKFVGLFHAGTYDRWDQTAQHGMASWGEDLENSWFKIYDKVIVASYYHADLIFGKRKLEDKKISVIPWKVDIEHIQEYQQTCIKENWVVFPHRHNPEKLDTMFGCVNVTPYEWKDTVKCKTKGDYYRMLAQSKICVSFSLQETFGIAMVEAVLLGCIPLVPDRLSYKEMYPKLFRYSGEAEFKQKLGWFCERGDEYIGHIKLLQARFEKNSNAFFNNLFGVLEEL